MRATWHDGIRPIVAGEGLLVPIVVALDLLTKAWAEERTGTMTRSSQGWGIGLVHNTGVAFGMGSSAPVAAILVSVIGVAVLATWFARARGAAERAGLALALGGGVANLLDRIVHGAVTDWIHAAGYPPLFNLADLALRAGLVVAVIALVRLPSRSGAEDREGSTCVPGLPES